MTTLRTGIEAAGRRRTRPAPQAAFTLIELLVVMGIIGVLVAMLLPAVNRAVIAVRNASCANRIAQLEAGLATFKNDWGVYPPSDDTDDDANVLSQECPGGKREGKNLLTIALIGPGADRKGWGRSIPDEQYELPFGGASETVAYGPYFQGDFLWTGREAFIPDAFPSPDRPILYYRFDRRGGSYDYQDNPTGDIGEGFQDGEHFELSATYETPDSREPRFHRKDYLLICAGADRMYGYIKDTDPPQAADRRNEVTEGTAICDDLTNFGR